MIHFQHDEPGACLRASEVKPKLDRFVAKYLETRKIEVPKSWRISPEHDALKYQMQFRADSNSKKVIDLNRANFRYYFGNIGSEIAKKKGVLYSTPICMRISCVCTETVSPVDEPLTLLELLSRLLGSFFKSHGFGTRNSKGFGAFSVIDETASNISLRPFFSVYYGIKYPDECDVNVLKDIWVIGNMMKSGFNFTFGDPNDYYKGRIFRYFTIRGIGSDKAFIKQKVLKRGSDSNRDSEEYSGYERFVFSRAMLGLPGTFEFRYNENTTTRSGKVEVSHPNIMRFKSPVLFRPYKNYLYFLPTEIPDAMFDAEFKLNDKPINTPTREEFDLIGYLDWFMLQFNTREDIHQFHNEDVAEVLDKRLQIIRSQKREGGNK
jgi:hypothetical protein